MKAIVKVLLFIKATVFTMPISVQLQLFWPGAQTGMMLTCFTPFLLQPLFERPVVLRVPRPLSCKVVRGSETQPLDSVGNWK